MAMLMTGGDQRRQAGAERLLAGVPALQQAITPATATSATSALVSAAANRIAQVPGPAPRIVRQRGDHEQRPPRWPRPTLATLNQQLGRCRAGCAAG